VPSLHGEPTDSDM